jgi:hypothetical protein
LGEVGKWGGVGSGQERRTLNACDWETWEKRNEISGKKRGERTIRLPKERTREEKNKRRPKKKIITQHNEQTSKIKGYKISKYHRVQNIKISKHQNIKISMQLTDEMDLHY